MNMKSIIVGGGCFWCLEAVFQQFKGIQSVAPGYTAGHVEKPDYKSVCSGNTGHAEVLKIEYDEELIDLETLLGIFFTVHDPTTLNRQGNDVGTQYRSIITYETQEEKEIIEAAMLKAEDLWDDPLVTQVVPNRIFHSAEAYHHNYFKKNPAQAYCTYVVNPKVQKAKAKFSNLI